MSRRNTRESKARRRAERERQRCSTPSGEGPRVVKVQAVQPALRPAGSGHRNADEHGSGPRSDADGGMIAATLDALQPWRAGKLSDSALWHKSFFDPPEAVDSTGLAASQ